MRCGQRSILLLPHPTCLPTPSHASHLPRLPVGWSVNTPVTLCLSAGCTSRSLPRPNHRAPPPPPPLVPPLPSLGPSQQETSKSKITITSTTTRSSKQPHRPATALSARTGHLHTLSLSTVVQTSLLLNALPLAHTDRLSSPASQKPPPSLVQTPSVSSFSSQLPSLSSFLTSLSEDQNNGSCIC